MMNHCSKEIHCHPHPQTLTIQSKHYWLLWLFFHWFHWFLKTAPLCLTSLVVYRGAEVYPWSLWLCSNVICYGHARGWIDNRTLLTDLLVLKLSSQHENAIKYKVEVWVCGISSTALCLIVCSCMYVSVCVVNPPIWMTERQGCFAVNELPRVKGPPAFIPPCRYAALRNCQTQTQSCSHTHAQTTYTASSTTI